MIDNNRVLSVRELNFAAKQLIEGGLPLLWVRGEISNFVSAASGHWYFSLKDEQAQVRCVMFRHKSQYLDWQPRSGIQVEVLALPSLYEARGEFQLTLEKMRPAGLGALFEAFERLKKRLELEGLFAESRKRHLPLFPARIGIVTSPQAAALRDVLTTLAKRMPGLPVILYPTPVQGEGSAQKIAQAIEQANQRKECEVLIVCRGGGSIEDLWAFNEEVVARAIVASHIPVVCGVGHETDFTIADFVADQRAATPTAAAQAATPDRLELNQSLLQSEKRMAKAMQRLLERAMQQLDYLQRRILHPAQRVQQQEQHLGQLQQRLQTSLNYAMQSQQWRLQTIQQRFTGVKPNLQSHFDHLSDIGLGLKGAIQRSLEQYSLRLITAQKNLQHLDPHQVLARGYSMVCDEQGDVIRDGAALSVGTNLQITFAQGWAEAEVKKSGN